MLTKRIVPCSLQLRDNNSQQRVLAICHGKFELPDFVQVGHHISLDPLAGRVNQPPLEQQEQAAFKKTNKQQPPIETYKKPNSKPAVFWPGHLAQDLAALFEPSLPLQPAAFARLRGLLGARLQIGAQEFPHRKRPTLERIEGNWPWLLKEAHT